MRTAPAAYPMKLNGTPIVWVAVAVLIGLLVAARTALRR